MKTIVLAYSGGLDTSIIVPWLREHYDARVVCVAADIGQGDELEGVREKAIASGADEARLKQHLDGNAAVTMTAGGLRIEVSDEQKVDAVIAALRKANGKLVSVQPVRQSLEELFLD